MNTFHELTAVALRDALRDGEITPTEVTEHYLERITARNDELGAFITVTAELALEKAKQLEQQGQPHGQDLPLLWGVPVADKDLHPRRGVPTSYGSRAFHGYLPSESDDLVRTMDAAKAISLGKTATSEFGLTGYTEGKHWTVKNPWALTYGAGGSSGGAAAAVAAGLLPVAPGSDGGGSIRIPAAACGLVGVKPSRGRVPSGSGMTSLAGMAVVGAIGRTVADAALLLDAQINPAGHGADHHFALRAPHSDGPYLEIATDAAEQTSRGGYRVGIATDSPWESEYEIVVEPAARSGLNLALKALRALGHEVDEISPAAEPGYPDAFRTIWQASAANIQIAPEHEKLLEPITRWLIAQGRALSAGSLAAALAWLTDYERRTIERFARFDAVITPMQGQRLIGSYDQTDGLQNFGQQVMAAPFTSYVNVSGLPAITLPVDVSKGLPVAVQLIGRPGDEVTLFCLAAQLEGELGSFTVRHPPGW